MIYFTLDTFSSINTKKEDSIIRHSSLYTLNIGINILRECKFTLLLYTFDLTN